MDNKLSFDYIALSNQEVKLLERIASQNIPDVVSGESLDRLFRHNLVENTMQVRTDGLESKIFMKAVVITPYGKDYLAYIRKCESDHKRNLRQSILVTILSAVLGALLSQPVWDFINALFI